MTVTSVQEMDATCSVILRTTGLVTPQIHHHVSSEVTLSLIQLRDEMMEIPLILMVAALHAKQKLAMPVLDYLAYEPWYLYVGMV